MSKTIAFHTLGCRVNTSDTQSLERQAIDRGLRIVPFHEQADIYVINTCTVTAQADQQCSKLARSARARNPGAQVVAVGCFVQAQPTTVAALDDIDLTLDNFGKDRLFDRLSTTDSKAGDKLRLPVLGTNTTGEPPPDERHWIPQSLSRSRAFVKVQDGCDENCSYCIIPRSRGPSRSRSMALVVSEIEHLLATGHRELVLVGVHLSDWGRDLPESPNFASLLRRLCEIEALPSLRVSSLEPEGVTDELIDALCHPKICPHLHLPVQSGSARVLEAMRRAYQPRDVEDAVRRIGEKLHDFGLGSDFIVGFPGETNEDFLETVSLIERLPFSYIHPFPYSERPGTDAVSYPHQVPKPERARRVRRLNELGKGKRAEFMQSRIGRTYRTWFSRAVDRRTGLLRGLTGNYLTPHVAAPAELANSVAEVRLTAIEGGKLIGELVRPID